MSLCLIRGGAPITLQLRKSLVREIKRGHAWLYSNAIETPPAAAGTCAYLVDKDGSKIASGIYDPSHPIPLRICRTRSPWLLDEDWLLQTLEQSISLRSRLFDSSTTGYRLVNGEGDGLPGLVIDQYAKAAVIKLDGGAPEGFYQPRGIARWLAERLGLEQVVWRSRQRGVPGETVWGPLPQRPIEFLENGMRFCADILVGQKTGFFLDQRDNRELVRSMCRECTVLNLFSFSGGFSVAAGLGGAQAVCSVDMAAPAIHSAQEHWRFNGLPVEKHSGIVADAFVYLESAIAKKELWDVVICDPPSFAPSEATKRGGLDAYQRLAQLAAKVTRHGGLLALASCSSHISLVDFETHALESLGRVRRSARLIACRSLPPDHPSPLAMPELRYLKFLLLQLDC